MGTLQMLPDDILRRQMCQDCFQYLSVPPITTNNRGETICGRCLDGSNRSKKYAKSIYNVLAEGLLFKCTNHFNGCTKLLSLAETKEHEQTCTYMKQECFFCSFSGNISQILNHSLKFHPENVSFDGTFSFWLNDTAFRKKFIFLKDNSIFHVTIDVLDDVFTAVISPVTKTVLPTINQYGVKFFKLHDALNFDFIHTDYGLLDVNLINCYKKNVGELVTFFGPGLKLCCEILLGQFSLDSKEIEFQQRFAKLRQSEVEVNNFKQELAGEKRKLSQQTEVYNTAMNVIKKMSYSLFKCCACQKITLKDTYYCLKMHCYCQNCLKSVCVVCKTIREYKPLEDVDHLRVPCDWPGCNQYLLLTNYLRHKSKCSKRPYKCPLQDCQEVVFSTEKFIEHWHSEIPALFCNDSIVLTEYGIKEYYWLLRNDVYCVLIDFNASNIQVSIEEVNVLPNDISFKCTGVEDRRYAVNFNSTMFCGRYHVNTNNRSNSGYPATQITISPN